VLGVVITAIGLLGDISQPARVWRCRSAEGISVASQALTAGLCVSWSLYGFMRGEMTQVWVNGAALVSTLIVMAGMVVYGDRTKTLISFVPVVLYSLAIGVVAFEFGNVAVGAIASCISMAYRVPQVVLAWRQPGGEGLSVVSFAASLACASLWIAYGALAGDVAVVATAVWGVAINAFVLLRTVTARRPTDATVESARPLTLAA
jgi:uncharacterized protein with PQ loop repeat